MYLYANFPLTHTFSCDMTRHDLHGCQIRTDEGRKLYTSYYLNTKFCHNCGSEEWFNWSLDPPTADDPFRARKQHEDAQIANGLEDRPCISNDICSPYPFSEHTQCCCMKDGRASKGFCIHHRSCKNSYSCHDSPYPTMSIEDYWYNNNK